MNYCLEVSDLTKKYDTFLLDRISFSLPEGCIMGFIGENGAGKSTTLKAILNIIKPAGGSVRIFGKDAADSENNRQIKEDIGIVFDECLFHNTLQAKDISSILSHVYKNWDQTLYFRYLDQLELPGRMQLKKFSRGMKMKLGIAAALSHHPRLLLLDEPTSGLDPVVRTEILDIFLEFIQKENHSILMSSHITTDLEKICDYITYIHKGKILLSDEKDKILETHGILKCPADILTQLDPKEYAGFRKNSFGCEVLLKQVTPTIRRRFANYTIDPATLEDIMVYYGKESSL